jgi:hypothetical protein
MNLVFSRAARPPLTFRLPSMQIIPRGFRPGRLAALPLLWMLGACDRGLLDTPAPPADGGGQRVLGVVEVTLSGIGTAQMTATARLVRAAPGPSLVLIPVQNGDGSGDGTLRLENEFVGSFTHGTRGAGGMLYMHAGFRVPNVTEGGTPYDTPRRNLTFLGAATTATIDTTPVRELKRFDGSNANPAIARQVRPTGMVNRSADGVLYPDGPDVLQVYLEHEVRTVTPPAGVTSVFPYGFVARGPGGGREIPVGGEGHVTFAFRAPLQATAGQDPYTVTFSFLAVEDTETRLTQSLEEQTPEGTEAFRARAAQLNASPLILLPGSAFADSTRKWRYVCAVRTAGSAASPDEFLFPPQPTVRSSAPNPYSTSNLARNGTISYVFDRPAPNPTPQNFAVNGNFGGRRFLSSGGYTGGGTTRLTTPPGDYFPGELVDVTLTSALTCEPRVARFRAAAGAASGVFAGDVVPITGKAVALADLNHDGDLDLLTVVPAAGAGSFSVQLGFGNGTFAAPTTYLGPPYANAIAVGDFNGDGNLDVAVTGQYNPNLVIFDGQGDGTLTGRREMRRSSGIRSLAVADLNADGLPDLALNNLDNDYVVVADAPGFTAYRSYRTGRRPWGVATADMDADGRLDVVTADSIGNGVTVLRGMGGGVFHRSFTRRLTLTYLPVVIAAGDVTRDGNPDVVVGGGPHTVLLVGDGRGGFGATVPLRTTAGGNIVSVMLGDVNGDGRLDLTAVDRNGSGGYVMLNTGSGLTYHSSFTIASTPRAAAMGDLNGDNRLDVVAVGASNTTVLLGQP